VATAAGYGSDLVVDLLRAAGIEYVALNPGPTYSLPAARRRSTTRAEP